MAQQQQDGGLRIGELAERAGISTDTVRYYERLGLMAVPWLPAFKVSLEDRYGTGCAAERSNQ